MLGAIREHATGVVAYAIIFVISIPFALWGIAEYLNFGGDQEVAEVNGEELSLATFQEAYQQVQRGQQAPSHLSAEAWSDLLRMQTLQQMIGQEVQRQFLERLRLRPPDEAVAEAIRTQEVFHTDGAFDPERYRNLLQANRISPPLFELRQRTGMARRWITESLENSAWIGPRQAREFESLRAERRDLRLWVLPWQDFVAEIEVSDEEIGQRYRRDRQNYRSPARARISYLELLQENLGEEELDDAEAEAYYETHAAEFLRPEVRKLRQVFLRGEDAAERARQLHRQLQEGADFEELAQTHSEDSASAPVGGLVGRVAASELPQDIGPIVFALGEGRLSEPVETERGVYLLRVDEIEEEFIPPFSEVRERVRAQALRQKRDRRYAAVAEDLEILAYENPESLDAAAEAIGAAVQTTEWIYVQSPAQEILRHPAIQEALQDETVQSGINSQRIDLDAGHAVVIRMEEYESEQVLDLESLREQIRGDLEREAGMREAQEYALESIGRLRGGADFAEEAKQAEAVMQTYAELPRTGDKDQELPPPLLRRIFSMVPPAEGSAYDQMVTWRGVAMLALDAVHRQEIAEVPREGLAQLRQASLLRELRSLEDSLSAQSEIKQYPERLQ